MNTKIYKIAILNAEAGGNKGAEAMLETLVIFLREKFPNSELYLEVGNNEWYYNKFFLKKHLTKTHILKFKPKSIFYPYSIDISNLDMAIDIGGINFTGNSKKGLIRSLIRYLPFVINKKKLIFFTQDLGPAKNEFARLLGKYIINYSEGFFSRSDKSYDEAIHKFKIKKNKVHGPFPDSTLIFKPAASNVDLIPDLKKKSIILSPSAIMFKKYGMEYILLFQNLYLRYENQYQIIFLVHNFTDNFGNSDEDICQQLADKCPNSILFNQNIESSKLKTILSKAEYVISSRYHVIVGALSQNIPVVAIGWNPKYLSFLKLYKKENWNIEFQNQKTLEEIIRIIEDESFIKSDLENINLFLKSKVLESFDLLSELISQD